MDSDNTFQRFLRKTSIIIRSRWTSRILFVLVLIAFAERILSDEIETTIPDISTQRLLLAATANIFLLGLFSSSWSIVVKAVTGVRVSFIPFALSQPLKLIPGGVAQPIYLAKQYHGMMSGTDLAFSFAGHAIFSVVVPGGFCLAAFCLFKIIIGEGLAIWLVAAAGVMLAPFILVLVPSFSAARLVVKRPGSKILTEAVLKVVGIGILGLTCHGISFWALSSDAAFEHVLLFAGSLGFGVLILPFPAGFGPREWFFIQFMDGVATSSLLVAFVAHRLLQMILEVLVSLIILQKRVFVRLSKYSGSLG